MIITIGINRGVPNIRAADNNHAARVDPAIVPDVASAISFYESSGGHLTLPNVYGFDTLAESASLLSQRKHLLETNIPTPEQLFGWTVNGSYEEFAGSLEYMVNITKYLNRQL